MAFSTRWASLCLAETEEGVHVDMSDYVSLFKVPQASRPFPFDRKTNCLYKNQPAFLCVRVLPREHEYRAQTQIKLFHIPMNVNESGSQTVSELTTGNG